MTGGRKRKTAVAAVLAAAALTLTGCTTAGGITALAGGTLDALYLGQYSEDYLKRSGKTAEQAQEEHAALLEGAAEKFAVYWGILDSSSGESYSSLSEETRTEITSLYEEIYAKARYEVGEASKEEDGTYAIPVTVYPADIMTRTYEVLTSEEGYAPYEAFKEKYAETVFTDMTEEEYAAFTEEYAGIIIGAVEEQLSELGYGSGETVTLHAERQEDGTYVFRSEDLSEIDGQIIAY